MIRPSLVIYFLISSSAIYAQDWDSLNSAGLQYYKSGKYADAQASFLNALEVAKRESGEVSDPYIHSLNNLAFVYKGSGDYSEAKRAFQRTVYLLEKLHTTIHVDQIEALTNLGNLYIEMGQYDSSEVYFQYALQKMSAAVKNREENYLNAVGQFELVMINLQNGFASLNKKKGQLQDAIEILDEQRKYLKHQYADAPQLLESYKTILLNLSGYYLEDNNPSEAKALINEYLNLPGDKNERSFDYLNAIKTLGDVHRQTNQLDSALMVWNQALSIMGNSIFQGSTLQLSLLNNIGELYAEIENYPKAIEKLSRACSLNESRGGINPRIYQTTLYNLAEAYQWSGDYAHADTVYSKLMKHLLHEVQHNFTYLSEAEKISFYRSQLMILEGFTAFALTVSGTAPLQKGDRPYINKAITQQLYDLQIITKGIILHSGYKMKNRILNGTNEKLKANYMLWEAKKNQLATLLSADNPDANQLKEFERYVDFLEQQLSRESAGFKKGFVMDTLSWRDIQKKLKPGEAAVEMIRFVNGLLYGALIITSETREQPTLAIIQSTKTRYLEKEYYRQYTNAIEYRMADTVSYDVYWKPISDAIRNTVPTDQKIARIYFSPDGIYNQINLNALYSKYDKQYVLDQVDLHQIVNTKSIVKREEPGPKRNTAVLFGRPSFSSTDFADLPGTEIEIDKIDKYLQTNKFKSKTYKQKQASESNLKEVNSPHILHLATHGFFENSSASPQSLIRILMNSGIVLSATPSLQASETEDGILTAYEALNLNLDTNELTVLSACETGLGEFYPGEGVYGLRLALTSAGAKHVLMSLWKVDDQATQELMTLFYKHWLKKPGDIRKAFKTAQQELRKKYPDPYYWGAFVLTGR